MVRTGICFVVALLGLAARPGAASARLLADINTTPLIASSSPREFVTVGDQVFFVATTPAAGVGLWKTDGTPAGTVLLRGFGTIRSQRFWLTPFGNLVLFVADDVVSGQELWRSDGTPAGTVRVRDIRDGVLGSNPSRRVMASAAGPTVPPPGPGAAKEITPPP